MLVFQSVVGVPPVQVQAQARPASGDTQVLLVGGRKEAGWGWATFLDADPLLDHLGSAYLTVTDVFPRCWLC